MTSPDPSRRKPKSDSTALALLVGMILAVGVTAAASFSAAGSGALQQGLRTLGFGRDTEIQAQQRKQAAVLAEFERIITRMDDEIGGLTNRVARTESNELTVNEQLGRLDSGVAALTGDVKDLRARSSEASGGEAWRKPVDHLNTAVSGARGDIITLRSSLDAHEQQRRNDLGAINRRIERIEKALAAPDTTASVATPAPPAAPPAAAETGTSGFLGLFGLRGSPGERGGHMMELGGSGH
jgi:TolA-binding protein